MNNITQNTHNLLKDELLVYFEQEGFQILGVINSQKYPEPAFLHNDGYGDQEDKQPDILAFDSKQNCHVVGLVKETRAQLENEESQTQYNVFLDQKDITSLQPYRLYLIVPSSLAGEITSFLTHYIHREYWYRITIVVSEIV